MRPLLLTLLFVGLGLGGLIANQASAEVVNLDSQSWPGEKKNWNGFDRYEFQFDGRRAFVVEPKVAAPGHPWVWRARFPSFHAEADRILLNRGFHVAHIDTNGMLGSERAMQHWDKFYHFMVEHGLNREVALEGVSRGGLFVYGFASRWPERVRCIYCDTPVCDVRSWPGGKGTGRGDPKTWQICLEEYGLTEETALEFKGNPIDRLQPIADAKIPALHIVSLNDVIVPPTENTFILAERYRKLGGKIDIMTVAEGTEKSGGHHFPHPDPVRVADFIERHTANLSAHEDHFVLRGSLDNCRTVFEKEKRGRVAFLGGSITKMDGWRQLTCEYLQQRFPQTEFDFVDAAIPSTGSTPGAFRFASDVLSHGDVDLLFEEAAVNDLHNMRTPVEMTRGMEGILRHARRSNPNMDVVVMHFVEPRHMANYRNDQIPEAIRQHEAVADHYGVSTIQLAKEVTERIDAGQFDWKKDFVNLHPSPYGHRIYASTIRRLLSTAWEIPLPAESMLTPHEMPEPIDRFSYDRGRYVPLDSIKDADGFEVVSDCDPTSDGVGGSVRDGFANVPMLVATKPNASFSMTFDGRAVGLFIAAGPDAGVISYQIDGGPTKTRDLFTKWSRGLHIPWVVLLESELEPGTHEIKIQTTDRKNESSRGHACRIVHLLVNGS
ncbi:SGNH/GDSL hydrolase family protein [Aporhodopirellula aestuarii]|uniref:GDSL-type esterase/lipase family protein n=1 Tax=Aporhodopirellula aestuarii TaxID=2950107 RepID=A0ABT0U8Z6_9BACT|nr:GDSL-type esterase/lipase family protein [Aporhodopirellula aestuarii]MCM2373385.1 GDSL-type esterase/lipase family protein [Aporhodopirellula aestuarii]